MPTTAEIMKLAFQDELKKIAFTRSGRKPIGIERLMEKEMEPDNTPSNAFSNEKVAPEKFKADIEKMSSLSTEAKKRLVGVGFGAAGALTLQKANQDRKMGRAMRLQQNSY